MLESLSRCPILGICSAPDSQKSSTGGSGEQLSEHLLIRSSMVSHSEEEEPDLSIVSDVSRTCLGVFLAN